MLWFWAVLAAVAGVLVYEATGGRGERQKTRP